jgi:hypothetical protein
MRAVREKKYSPSSEITVSSTLSSSLRSHRAAVIPAMPLPIITTFFKIQLKYLFDKKVLHKHFLGALIHHYMPENRL